MLDGIGTEYGLASVFLYFIPQYIEKKAFDGIMIKEKCPIR